MVRRILLLAAKSECRRCRQPPPQIRTVLGKARSFFITSSLRRESDLLCAGWSPSYRTSRHQLLPTAQRLELGCPCHVLLHVYAADLGALRVVGFSNRDYRSACWLLGPGDVCLPRWFTVTVGSPRAVTRTYTDNGAIIPGD